MNKNYDSHKHCAKCDILLWTFPSKGPPPSQEERTKGIRTQFYARATGYDHKNKVEVGFTFCGNEECKPDRDEEGFMTWEGHRLTYWE